MTRGRIRLSGWPLAAVLAGIAVFLYLVRHILLPFVIAAAVAYITTPLVGWLQGRLHLRRWIVALAISAIFLALFAAAAYWVGSKVVAEVKDISTHAPQVIHQELTRVLGGEHGRLLGREVDAEALTQSLMSDLGKWIGTPRQAMEIATLGLAAVLGTVLGLVLLVYFLLDGPRLARGVLGLVPPEHRPQVQSFAVQVDPLLMRYVRGLVVVVIYTSVATWLGVGLLFHLPHAVLLSLATGLLELIPVVGPAASAVMLGVTALVHSGIWVAVGFAVFCFVLRLSIDQAVAPLVLGHAVEIHPVVVIFAFLAGGLLLGALGVLIAIPGVAVLKILLDNYYAIPVDP